MVEIAKKKEPEVVDSHVREAYVEEKHENYDVPTPTPLSPTGIPMPLVGPIPVATPSQKEYKPSAKNELMMISGINKKTAKKLEKLGINNIDDLAEASGEDLAKQLKVDPSIAQKWIARAKELH